MRQPAYVDERLRRDAAVVETVAANVASLRLDEQRAKAKGARNACGTEPATAAANGDEIVVLSGLAVIVHEQINNVLVHSVDFDEGTAEGVRHVRVRPTVICRPMRPSHVLLVTIVLLTLSLSRCAIVGQPRGGEADERGPVLDTLLSTPNFQVNSRPNELVLEFDEFINLKNASQNVLLTPVPESGRPSYIQRGRRLTVDLSEVTLRDSTTYQLQFGDAVQDLNEGNPSPGLRYVFSTGSFLDSLQVSGRVVDSQTEEPVIGALVGLYAYENDSVGLADWSDIIVRESPNYFVRADSSGRFKLDYLAPATYYLAAYTDGNANYRFNAGAELLGVADTLLEVAPGRIHAGYELRVSPERPPLIALRADQAFPGLLRITLNQAATPEVQLLNVVLGERLAQYEVADTIFVAYRPAQDSLADVVVQLEGETDTARVREPARNTRPALRYGGVSKAEAGTNRVMLGFTQPLARLERDSVRIYNGPLPANFSVLEIDSSDLRQLVFVPDNDTVSAYRIDLLPGALTSVFDSINRDTFSLIARPNLKEGRGEVTVTLSGLEAKAYVVELIDEGDRVERIIRLPAAQDALASGREEAITLARVAPGSYSLRLIDDDNADGRYTPGSRRLARRPERVRRFPIQQVRADWTVEEQIFTVGERLDETPVLDGILD